MSKKYRGTAWNNRADDWQPIATAPESETSND